ncbi:hypothetical protein AVEN_197993-1 [Araneus ventricosus]|uniref:Uncharacterized protein n=1 Tax=Araneus ventricosus TaxID=182803 RepID=A0A4Y2IBV3_ARAVE|nr:hypothetical protein AVEN_197993-1 [Araneus ventricosus]
MNVPMGARPVERRNPWNHQPAAFARCTLADYSFSDTNRLVCTGTQTTTTAEYPGNLRQSQSSNRKKLSFPSYLHRFNLRTHDNCSCGEKGDPIHYAPKCRFALSWHFQTPPVSLKLQWLKNVVTYILSRSRLRLLMPFICDENNLIVEDNHRAHIHPD